MRLMKNTQGHDEDGVIQTWSQTQWQRGSGRDPQPAACSGVCPRPLRHCGEVDGVSHLVSSK
ncbi:hypothetical protein [Nocardia abscessus]|uniref:hypothetical protein n=1 Tax=Nocardia abscessus TaxID=120957 RepID=UPI00245724BC|nr:hypothetical protein [Nocardia abscessus]